MAIEEATFDSGVFEAFRERVDPAHRAAKQRERLEQHAAGATAERLAHQVMGIPVPVKAAPVVPETAEEPVDDMDALEFDAAGQPILDEGQAA